MSSTVQECERASETGIWTMDVWKPITLLTEQSYTENKSGRL